MTVLLLERLHLNDLRKQALSKKVGPNPPDPKRDQNFSPQTLEDPRQPKLKAALKHTERILAKLEQLVLKHLSTVQLKYELQRFGDGNDDQDANKKSLKDLGEDFESYVTSYVVNLFGGKMPHVLTSILRELNLPESMIKELQKNKRQRKTSGKRQNAGGAVAQQERRKTP